VARLVAAGLGEAALRFGTPVPPALTTAAARGEPSAALLRRPGRGLLLHDLRHLPGLRARLEWLREAALPDTEYLRWRYEAAPDATRGRLLLLFDGLDPHQAASLERKLEQVLGLDAEDRSTLAEVAAEHASQLVRGSGLRVAAPEIEAGIDRPRSRTRPAPPPPPPPPPSESLPSPPLVP